MECPIDGSPYHGLWEHLVYVSLPLTLLAALIGGAAGLVFVLLGVA